MSTPLSGPYTTVAENTPIEVPSNAVAVYCEIKGGSSFTTDNCTYSDPLNGASDYDHHYRLVYITDRTKDATLTANTYELE